MNHFDHIIVAGSRKFFARFWPTRDLVLAAVHADFARFILPTETRFDNMYDSKALHFQAAFPNNVQHVLVVWPADVGADCAPVRALAPLAG